MPTNSIIIGVDLAPIKPIPKVITFQSDITTEKCRATIRTHLKTWKADVVLHDGAPNVGTAWVQDSYNQAELALHSLKLATEFLVEGGTFVTKVFRSKDYNSLLWVCNQLFTKVEATKPPSSRNVSAEIFVVCRGFKAPKRIDPKLLDPRSVFEDVAGPAPNNEAKVYNPEIKKRKREGYEEGEYIQFKEISASEFINTVDPIAILGQYNKLSFEQPKNGDVALAALDKLPETTEEIRLCCADLKVLGRKEFKLLLKWRLKVREIFGFPTKKSQKAAAAMDEEVATVENMDEELRIQEELQRIKEKESAKKKRERRRENEKKQKEIVRMQMNMTAPMDIGMEQEGPRGEGAMFRLKTIDANAALNKITKGKMAVLKEQEKTKDYDFGSDGEDYSSDEEADRLEAELDNLYDQYRERKAASDAKYRAKKARKEGDDEEWEGVSGDEKAGSDDDDELEVDSSDGDSDSDDDEPGQKLITDLDGVPESKDGLSKRAKNFFSQGVFAEIPGLLDEPESEEEETQEAELVEAVEELKVSKNEKKEKKAAKEKAKNKLEEESEGEDDFEIVKNNEDDDWENVEKKKKNGKPGKLQLSDDLVTALANLDDHRHRHHHRRGHDPRPPACDRREDKLRRHRRRLHQARLQGPRRPSRLVPRRRVQARQAAQAHHQGRGGGHQGEAPCLQRSSHQEGGRGQGQEEV